MKWSEQGGDESQGLRRLEIERRGSNRRELRRKGKGRSRRENKRREMSVLVSSLQLGVFVNLSLHFFPCFSKYVVNWYLSNCYFRVLEPECLRNPHLSIVNHTVRVDYLKMRNTRKHHKRYWRRGNKLSEPVVLNRRLCFFVTWLIWMTLIASIQFLMMHGVPLGHYYMLSTRKREKAVTKLRVRVPLDKQTLSQAPTPN